MKVRIFLFLFIIGIIVNLDAQPTLEKLKNWARNQPEAFNSEDVTKFINGERSEGDIDYSTAFTFSDTSTQRISVAVLDANRFVLAYTFAHPPVNLKTTFGGAIIGTISGNSLVFGPQAVFDSSDCWHVNAVKLTANRIVVAYHDIGNDGHGKARIGSIAGNQIFFGNEQDFSTTGASYLDASPLDGTRFLLAYQDISNSYYGTALVGTVTGSTITYGSKVVFHSDQTDRISIKNLDASKLVVAYRDVTNSHIGGVRIGTVSGSTLTFGAETIFNNESTNYISVSELTDSKFVVTWFGGMAKIGDVTGTNITLGAEYNFNLGGAVFNVARLDDTHFAVTYQESSNNIGSSIVGIVSGTTITFGTEYQFNNDRSTHSTMATFDDTHFVVAYRDADHTLDGHARLAEVDLDNLNIWDGSSGTEWNTGANWSWDAVPTSADNVNIPDVTNQPVIADDVTADCNSLTLESGTSLTIESSTSGTGSLINTGSLVNNGTINFERYVSSGVWHLFSPPISDATANIFLSDYLQYYDGSWNDIVDPGTALTPAMGYAVWDVSRATTYLFAGEPNTGGQSISITSANNGWNLLGNPYPSGLDWSQLDNTYGAVYYWDPGISDYVQWNDGVGDGSPNVPAMQGFWIKALSDGIFSVDDSHRTHTGSTLYYKNAESISNHLELQVDGNGYYDRLFIRLNNLATEEFDLLHDAYKLFSPEEAVPRLYSLTGNEELSIDQRPECSVIQLGFACGENGGYSIKVNDLTDITTLVLEDTKTGTNHDLKSGNYTFEYAITDDEKRFRLHFEPTAIDEQGDDRILIYASGKTIYISSDEIIQEGPIRVMDIMGRTLMENDMDGKSILKLPTGFDPGIYIVTIEFDTRIISKKVLVN